MSFNIITDINSLTLDTWASYLDAASQALPQVNPRERPPHNTTMEEHFFNCVTRNYPYVAICIGTANKISELLCSLNASFIPCAKPKNYEELCNPLFAQYDYAKLNGTLLGILNQEVELCRGVSRPSHIGCAVMTCALATHLFKEELKALQYLFTQAALEESKTCDWERKIVLLSHIDQIERLQMQYAPCINEDITTNFSELKSAIHPRAFAALPHRIESSSRKRGCDSDDEGNESSCMRFSSDDSSSEMQD